MGFKHIAALTLLFGLARPGVSPGEEHRHAAGHAHASHERMAMDPTPPYPQSARDCSEMQLWDPAMNMCMPFPMAGMPMRMFMLSGSVYGGYVAGEGPRGRGSAFSTSMIMADLGTTLGDRHYLNLDLMLTAEKWTLPEGGYPLLLQVGEERANGQPYRDAQHPHSSPIMGLTFSDTIRLGDGRDALKLFFAPRGASTDGPVPFMHRPTGMINPDAPLGHHVGQDVGHISSTVLGASLKVGKMRFEGSVFSGEEPQPTRVDLPLGAPDSGAVRVLGEISPELMAMASVAYVSHKDSGHPVAERQVRVSGSVYHRLDLGGGWQWQNAFLYGGVTNYDHASVLSSFGEEFIVSKGAANLWGRLEVLERTPNQLGIAGVVGADSGRWVGAATLGYTHYLARFGGASLGLGGSITSTFLPGDFATAYGGNPWSGRVFLQLKGMRMWEL